MTAGLSGAQKVNSPCARSQRTNHREKKNPLTFRPRALRCALTDRNSQAVITRLLHVYYALTKTVLTELRSAADTEKLLGEPQIALPQLHMCAQLCAHVELRAAARRTLPGDVAFFLVPNSLGKSWRDEHPAPSPGKYLHNHARVCFLHSGNFGGNTLVPSPNEVFTAAEVERRLECEL